MKKRPASECWRNWRGQTGMGPEAHLPEFCGTRYSIFARPPPTAVLRHGVRPGGAAEIPRARSGIPTNRASWWSSRCRGWKVLTRSSRRRGRGGIWPPDVVDDDDGSALIEDAAELGEDTIGEVEVEVSAKKNSIRAARA